MHDRRGNGARRRRARKGIGDHGRSRVAPATAAVSCVIVDIDPPSPRPGVRTAVAAAAVQGTVVAVLHAVHGRVPVRVVAAHDAIVPSDRLHGLGSDNRGPTGRCASNAKRTKGNGTRGEERK
jgi:hypothetical protein